MVWVGGVMKMWARVYRGMQLVSGVMRVWARVWRNYLVALLAWVCRDCF